MEHQLGRISIVSWQGRRPRDGNRPNGLSALLVCVVSASLILLLMRFGVGVALPLVLLQLAFALLVTAGALLLMRAAVSLILRLQQR